VLHLPRNSFYGLAAFCFFIALIQLFLNSQPRPAAAFAVFGLLALLIGYVFPDHSASPPQPEDNTK
jgi:hypothetical protein